MEISEILFSLRKNLQQFFKINFNNYLTEKSDTSLFLPSEIYSKKFEEICFNKYQYLAEVYNIDIKLKDEVDKYTEYFNIEKILEKQSQILKTQNKQIESQEESKTAVECIICMEKERRTLFYPCMHLITCENCGFNKIKTDCPQCHTKIDKKELVYD